MFWNHHKFIKHFSQMKFPIEDIWLCPVNVGAHWILVVRVYFSKYIASEIIEKKNFFFFFSDLGLLSNRMLVFKKKKKKLDGGGVRVN